MKWGSKYYDGEVRYVKKYAWSPIRICGMFGTVNWRWLEPVKIRQVYETYNFGINPIIDIKIYLFGGYWINKGFEEIDLDQKRDDKLKKLGI